MSTHSGFERPPADEASSIAAIVRGILTIQTRYASQQQRPPGRGTHTKGVCVGATFEVFDLGTTIGDTALAGRLARGLYARPGVYPATVRFANAASTVRSDQQADVRAMSFAVAIPAGVVATDARRQDFSMNNAPIFPINDARTFAALLTVNSAPTRTRRLRALWSLPLRDLPSLGRTAVLGARQQRAPRLPYQQIRYWSTVPFAHGADEVVKYSAIPGRSNPAHEMHPGPEMLADELRRHVQDDTAMASFDFAIQLLDTERMTHRGRRHDASFWVENAAVAWDDTQAPFHVVGRLTLTPHSVCTPDVCEAMHIDVTENTLPDHRPLGGINRARWAAESASRKARLQIAPTGVTAMSESTVPPPPAPAPRTGSVLVRSARALRHRIGAITVRSLVRGGLAVVALVLLLVAGLSLATILYTSNGGGMLPPDRVDHVEYADQGWGPGLEAPERQTYYYTPQGAVLKDMRYSWFVHLEMPWGRQRFADPEVLRRYGFVVDPPTPQNPDGLPVGFARHFDPQLNEDLVDITCAACHTGQLNVTRNGRTTAVRIDGGSALHAFTDANFGHFVPTMVSSMVSTASNPLKFNRFARKVLGETYPAGRLALHRELRTVIGNFGRLAWNEKTRGLVPTEEGYGRTDALARIANTVFAENLDPANYTVGNAPVNYPPVWNIWKFDWVQYNSSVSQPMARNIGEAMGTGSKYALVDRYGRPLPPEQRFRSTALIENLHTIEVTLRKLQPPVWPEHILGAIDRQKAERGKLLFNEHCVGCHGPHIAPPALKAFKAPLKTESDAEWVLKAICVDDIGTDPNTAMNFFNATVDLTRTGLTAEDLRAVARRALQANRDRKGAYLTGEIQRLEAERGAPSGVAPAAGDGLDAQLADLRTQLAGLDSEIAQQLSGIDPSRISVGAALSFLGTMIREKAYADMRYTDAERADRDGFGILDLPQVLAAYKPRPMGGIWASPPFLHNGSVPTIYDLLSPVSERPTTFRVGSREFDPVRLGLALPESGYWVFDTTQSGNRNMGHEFNHGYVEWTPDSPPQRGLIGPFLSPEERLAIIEHLKLRNDDVDGPQEPRVVAPSYCSPGAVTATPTHARLQP
jgi:hypothetical protein